MKLSITLAALAGIAVQAEEIPVQTFYVPMPETDTFHQTFEKINSVASGDVISLVAVSISTPGTVVWYDHWEDNYDVAGGSDHLYSSAPLADSTEVWGDGNCNNGYAPGTTCNSPSDDRLTAGQSIVLKSYVDVPSHAGTEYVPGDGVYKYDGRDKILASYPISVVRGNYPQNPGSLMAGAIEVLDTNLWGTKFVAPVGEDMGAYLTRGFEHVALYIMAKAPDTVLTFSDGTSSVTLGEGESYTHEIGRRGETVDATKAVQVDLITGDKSSNYELRWFSLLPREDWTNSYFSPVGDTNGECKIYLYNPNNKSIKVKVETVYNQFKDYWISAGSYTATNVIKQGSGAALTSGDNFLALSMTDAGGSGRTHDWGFPVQPVDMLSDEVLIGWGWGCTSLNCNGGGPRSVVWVSPVETADIYVDIDNDGTPDSDKTIYNARRLSSNTIQDGTDISGAVIWAVKPGEASDSTETVPIAAAWGQNAHLYQAESESLDLGTLVPAFPGVTVTETVRPVVGDIIRPGDEVEYTIQVKNSGQKQYPVCGYKLKYPGQAANLPYQAYAGSCVFIDHNGDEESCSDDALKSDSGLCSPDVLPKRGKVHTYKFRAIVNGDIPVAEISDNGILTQPGFGPDLTYQAPAPVIFDPSITISKTVHVGSQASCSNGEESVTTAPGADVTACYLVTNLGNTHLDDVQVSDDEFGLSSKNIGTLAPGASEWVKLPMKMPQSTKSSNGKAVGTPKFANSVDIPTYEGGDVEAYDPAEVIPKDPTDAPTAAPTENPSVPDVSIEKTVHRGDLASCHAGWEVQHGFANTVVTYCYAVTNTGNVKLTTAVTDGPVGVTETVRLEPGETKWIRKVSKITKNLTSPGKASATAVDGSGTVTDEDSAGVKLLRDRTCP